VTLVLKKGRERIETAWIKQRYQLGGFCTLGAIDYIDVCRPRIGPSFEAGKLLALSAGLLTGQKDLTGVIGSWNDIPCRTKEEVLQVFDRAIVKSMEGDYAI